MLLKDRVQYIQGALLLFLLQGHGTLASLFGLFHFLNVDLSFTWLFFLLDLLRYFLDLISVARLVEMEGMCLSEVIFVLLFFLLIETMH
jgi:hypothetical protein